MYKSAHTRPYETVGTAVCANRRPTDLVYRGVWARPRELFCCLRGELLFPATRGTHCHRSVSRRASAGPRPPSSFAAAHCDCSVEGRLTQFAMFVVGEGAAEGLLVG
jgi:hypothetical protein